MTAMNSRASIPPRVKVAELASSLSKYRAAASETSNVNVNVNGNSNGSSSSRLASPLMIYQAGLILYEMSRRVDASDRTTSVNVNKMQRAVNWAKMCRKDLMNFAKASFLYYLRPRIATWPRLLLGILLLPSLLFQNRIENGHLQNRINPLWKTVTTTTQTC